MAQIKLQNIAHSYNPNSVDSKYALKPFDMTWADGGRYAILGPSGCGKSTMLNIMSGIVKPSEGRLLFDGVDVTEETTSDRNIAQVFQFPVIYGTMTVYDNLAFPLVCRGYDKAFIQSKVNEVAEALSLEGLLSQSARKLTADQKQLISLGRGLVRDNVAAILMDEPLTVIDPDLKFRLRRKLKEINQKYQSTLIYVTHDQNEAMTFADNIIVMSEGEVVQAGTPKELFERPNTTFVGYFIGSPAMNLFETEASSDNSVKINNSIIKTNTNLASLKDKKVKLGIRSEFIKIADNQKDNLLDVNVDKVEDLGNYKLLTAKMGNLTIKSKINRDTEVPSSNVKLHIPAEKCCVYRNEKLI